MMSSKERIGSAIGHLAEDLRKLLASEHVSSFVKIPRVCNRASHELAKYGMVNNRTPVWLGSVSGELQDIIHWDCNNSISI
jgi:hypothetical protein